MNQKMFWLSLVAIISSFTGGFLLANALNRSELTALRGENERLKTAARETTQNQSEFTLSDEEIKQRIEEADRNPENYAYQKNLGLALYRYAAMKQNTKLLAEVGRLLNRVYENDSKDYDVAVTLGNIYFDIGYFKKENVQFEKSRGYYERALQIKPNDADVRTDLGLTYFLIDPPDNKKALGEFQKTLEINPKHEKTLQVLTEVYLNENNLPEAEKQLSKLKEVNAANQYIAGLETRLSELRANSQKK